MALVRAFEIEGLRLWFPSNDHEPPHFHAKRSGEWEVRVRFLLNAAEMLEIKWQKRPISAAHRKVLVAGAENHRVELLEQWFEIQDPQQ